jgi:hypothetical protein
MANIYDLSDTWNAGATVFTAIKMNVTDTASAAGSLLMDLQVGGSSKFKVDRTGSIDIGGTGSGDTDFLSQRGSVFLRTAYTGSVLYSGVRFEAPAFSISNDVILNRDAANTFGQRNGVAAQAFNLYNTYTDASNYERGYKRFVSNNFDIGTEAAGTGTVRNVQIRAGTQNWVFNANGGTTFPANSISVLSSFTIGRAAGVLTLFNENQTSGSAFEYVEQTAPAAPAANRVRVYAEDNGSGKTRLMALFPTGAAQQIAIEP